MMDIYEEMATRPVPFYLPDMNDNTMPIIHDDNSSVEISNGMESVFLYLEIGKWRTFRIPDDLGWTESTGANMMMADLRDGDYMVNLWPGEAILMDNFTYFKLEYTDQQTGTTEATFIRVKHATNETDLIIEQIPYQLSGWDLRTNFVDEFDWLDWEVNVT